MARKHHTVKKKAFTSPGSLIYVGKPVEASSETRIFSFNEMVFQEHKLRSFKEVKKQDGLIDWLQLDGIHDIQMIDAIGKKFHLHPLLQEDILNTEQKPKLEHFGEDHLFVVLKILQFNENLGQIDAEHIALVLGSDYVLSFQESGGTDAFQPVEERLKASIGKTRKGKADYLFYSLCDVVVDSYYVLLENFSEKLEELEMRIIANPDPRDQKSLYAFRRELLTIRKAVAPLRDIFGMLVRDDSTLIKESTNIYFRDIYDHVLQVLEVIDSYREMIENIQNIYLNNLSNRMNSVMKTLTVFTAIFMPLTFIVGIYGMNFENMPELKNPNGYFYTLSGMGLLGVILWVYFKWKKYM